MQKAKRVKRFISLWDIHFGFERKSGHKTPLHDAKAITVALEFAKDFKPDVVIVGGDGMDLGCISHHNVGKPGRTEGLRLLDDAKGMREEVIAPLEALGAKEYVWLLGNHEAWLNDLEESFPALEGMMNIRSLLHLGEKWQIIEQGGYYNLGKMTFCHGDQLSGSDTAAKNAVISFERSIRFGHLHSFSAFTKSSPVDTKAAKSGISMPALCLRGPSYGKNRPNKWSQGIGCGFIREDGTFNDYVAIITNGTLTAPNGKTYQA